MSRAVQLPLTDSYSSKDSKNPNNSHDCKLIIYSYIYFILQEKCSHIGQYRSNIRLHDHKKKDDTDYPRASFMGEGVGSGGL